MFTRRRFIKIGAASVGSLALPHFSILPAMAQSGTSDYKALVCVFLFGGNDSNNMIIPADDRYQNLYVKYRQNLALTYSKTDPTKNQLTQVDDASGNPWYLPNELSDLAKLFGEGHLAIAANVGPLVQLITQKSQLNNPLLVPSHLFSHADQQFEWQTSDPTETTGTGWPGRAADQVKLKNLNPAGEIPPFFSVAGNSVSGVGIDTQPIDLAPGGSLDLHGYDTSSTPPTEQRSLALYNLLATDTGLRLANSADGTLQQSIAFAQALRPVLQKIKVPDNIFQPGSLGQQLKQVAQIIMGRDMLKMQRQIFFCSLGGFDTHTDELARLSNLNTQLNSAINDFYTFLESQSLTENVTLFTESDFSRTFAPNSTDGSDHAWGSHHMVVGGAVKGQQVYGTFPNLDPGGPSDFDTRGRWVPNNPVDQYGAALVQWFGVDSNQVFPNLQKHFGNDPNPFTFLPTS